MTGTNIRVEVGHYTPIGQDAAHNRLRPVVAHPNLTSGPSGQG
ncbi:hypothetical protein [Arthrobacter sp. Z4-13]